ncbi:hypothetical protein HOG17_00035 [Candidatus Peregrinibacteria bacterium]|nr:hypothetical protein [Candidatus Peregrinibacteria bacterium]MBT4147650.1 hypothetical protein [Candidatus Peregrinibacteria bacterium]MBT4456260.1 hypothetical protein [Candidatus Peregrinibacteria bacterium]
MSDTSPTPDQGDTRILSSQELENVRVDLEAKVKEAKKQKERQLQGKLSDRAGSIKGAFTVAGLLREAEEAKKFYDDVKAAGEVPEDFNENYRRILETIEELERQYEANDKKQKELSEVPEVQERIQKELEESGARLSEKKEKTSYKKLVEEIQRPDLSKLKEALIAFHEEDMRRREEVKGHFQELQEAIHQDEELNSLIEGLKSKNYQKKGHKIGDPEYAIKKSYMRHNIGAPNREEHDTAASEVENAISHYQSELDEKTGVTQGGTRRKLKRIIEKLKGYKNWESGLIERLNDYIDWRNEDLRKIHKGAYADVMDEAAKKAERIEELGNKHELPRYQGTTTEAVKELVADSLTGRNYRKSMFEGEEAGRDDALRQTAWYFANTIAKEESKQ